MRISPILSSAAAALALGLAGSIGGPRTSATRIVGQGQQLARERLAARRAELEARHAGQVDIVSRQRRRWIERHPRDSRA